MNHEKIDRMKQEYEQIEVPEALKTQVEAGIRKGKRETQKGSCLLYTSSSSFVWTTVSS